MEKCNFLSTVNSFVRSVSLLTYCFKRSHKDIHEDINALSQNVTKISFFFPWHVSQSSEVGVSKPYVYFLLMNTITIVSCFT